MSLPVGPCRMGGRARPVKRPPTATPGMTLVTIRPAHSKCPCQVGSTLRTEIAQPPHRCSRQRFEEPVSLAVHCCTCPCHVGNTLHVGLAQPLPRRSGLRIASHLGSSLLPIPRPCWQDLVACLLLEFELSRLLMLKPQIPCEYYIQLTQNIYREKVGHMPEAKSHS